ncbi:hypothetical protein AB0D08_06660 [Kitasatospora sp. NPDC048540]|uniref:hypothetical protein n=1 Tax=Kitasatospora sp. NPDC048540 TaxID=3155634 RepID=UPI0033FD2802
MISSATISAIAAHASATLAVALFDAAALPQRTDQVLAPDGIGVGTCATHTDGPAAWLQPRPALPDHAPTANGPGSVSGGTRVVFQRFDGRILESEQVRGRDAAARAARTRSDTLLSVITGLPSGSAPGLRLRKIIRIGATGRRTPGRGHR